MLDVVGRGREEIEPRRARRSTKRRDVRGHNVGVCRGMRCYNNAKASAAPIDDLTINCVPILWECAGV